MRLIKFCVYNEHLLETLENITIFFSKVSNFNDPFEGIHRFKIYSDNDEFKNFYLKEFHGKSEDLEYHQNNKEEFFKKHINYIFDWKYETNGVCCFSDESMKNDILMWSHYTDKHKGICLIFNDNLRFIFKENKLSNSYVCEPSGPHVVNYTKEYLDYYPSQKIFNIRSFFTTKFQIWSYENEYRYISPIEGNFYFKKDCLEEIIFGLRTSIDSKNTIKNIVNKNFNNIKYKRIILKKDKFDFDLIDD
jgi:hypothetical protein